MYLDGRRTPYTQKWKEAWTPTKEKWTEKIVELANLTTFVREKNLNSFVSI